MNTDKRKFVVALQSAMFTGAIAAAAVAFVPAANASIWTSGTGGTACKAASGPGADVFYFNNLYAENVSTNSQYLSCGFADVHPGSNASALQAWLSVKNTTGARATVVCALQTGYGGYAVNTAIQSVSVDAGGTYDMNWNSGSVPAIPPKESPFAPYTASCLIPAGVQLYLVNLVMAGTIT